MRHFIFFSLLYTCLSNALASVIILFLAEISWGTFILILMLSVILFNTIHAVILQVIILPYLEKDSIPNTSKFFFTLFPWMMISALMLLFIQQPDPISLSVIAIQYFTASFSYFFYFSELKKDKKERNAGISDQKVNIPLIES